jgi:hypothetical protein
MTREISPFLDYFIGLDLGKVSDYTALAVLERSTGPDGEFRYDVRSLQRGALGTPYPKIVEAVKGLMAGPELRPSRGAPAPPDPVLVVDATGVGIAVVDMFLKAEIPATITPLTITSGGQVRRDPWPSTRHLAYWAPKIELVGTTQMLLQTGRLRVAPGLELADVLRRELQTFEVRMTQSANETFGAWREGAHDDLVLATAMAAFVGERHVAPCWRFYRSPTPPDPTAWRS